MTLHGTPYQQFDNPDPSTYAEGMLQTHPDAHARTSKFRAREEMKRRERERRMRERLADAFEPIAWKRRRF